MRDAPACLLTPLPQHLTDGDQVATAERDFRMARAWLSTRLRRAAAAGAEVLE